MTGATTTPGAAMLEGAQLLARHGGTVEIRIPKTVKGTISGYFDDLGLLAQAVGRWDGVASIYVTLNPVNPALLARANNRLREFARETTADKDIVRRVWFPVDLDPGRPAGISATEAELTAGLIRRDEVAKFLGELGFPEPVLARSGNGGHLLYALDLPNDAATTEWIERGLKALNSRFTDAAVIVDEGVFNPARIWKLYGTVAVKGDATAERPHRRAAIEHVPAVLTPVDPDALAMLAAMSPKPTTTYAAGANGHGAVNGHRPTLDLVELFQSRGWYLRHLHDAMHAVTCPWAAEHADTSGLSATVIFTVPPPGGFDCKHSGCTGRGLKDVLRLLRPATAEEAPPDRMEDPEADAPLTWPALQPLPTELLPVSPFVVDTMLPPALAPWIADVATRAQCPPEYVAVGVVVAAASVVGRQVGIRPKRHDDWLVVPNLWGAAIGHPGLMKTAAMHEARRGLRRLIADARAAYDAARTEHEFAATATATRRAAVEAAMKAAAKRGEAPETFRAAFDESAEPPAPVERRYEVNDATVEKLGALLNENPNGLLVFRDELVGWLRLMEAEGHENDRSFYCEAWNGSGSYTYDRIVRGTLHIEAATVSVLGGIQPMPLAAYLGDTFAHGQDDGLIQRFQLMVWPDHAGAWRNVDHFPDSDARIRMVDVFRALDRLDLAALGVPEDPDAAIPALHFTPEAQARFDTWRTGLEAQLRDPAEHPVIVAHLAKFRSLMPSLALVFHVIDCAPTGRGGPISEDAAQRAIAWCRYLEPHARRVYETVSNPGRAAAARLAARLPSLEVEPFTARWVRQRGWAGLTEPAVIEDALARLEALGWIRSYVPPRGAAGGRPGGLLYRANPAVKAKP